MKRFWLAAWILMLGFAGTPFAAPFQNGSFDIGAPVTPTCYLFDVGVPPVPSDAIPGWTVSVGSVDWIGPCIWTSQDGTHSLDLLGNGKIGGVQQTFDTIPGATYQVSFQLAGNPSTAVPGSPPLKPLTVTVAGITQNYTFDVTGHSTGNMGWTQQTFTFVASGSTSTINFVSDMTSAAGGFAGAALDNVSIVQTGAANVPAWTGSGGTVIPGISNPPPIYPPPIPPQTLLPMICSGPGSNWSPLLSPLSFPPAVAGNGTAGPATLSYYASPGGLSTGMCGTWGFSKVATASGDVALNWSYGGFHSFFAATAELSAFVIRTNAADSTYSLVSAGPAYCGDCSPPSGGFGYSGQVTLPGVMAGDTYGFVMTGSHFDGTDVLRGTLTVTGTLPTMTTLSSSLNPATAGSSVTFTATVSGSNPAGTVTFSDGANIIAGCSAVAIAGVGNVRTAACPTSSLAVGNHSIGARYSGDIFNASSAGSPLTQVINAAANLATPSLIRVVATGGAGAFVIGRVDGATSIPVTLQVDKGSCNGGSLGEGATSVGSITVPTDASGYFGATVSGVNPGEFVAVTVTSPSTTAKSACIASSGDNDFWPKALDFGTLPSLGDYIDAPGKVRWYKFSVTPGQKIQVTLSGLPADYDLVVFKDINQAFVNQLVPTGAAALTKLSAEFAPSTFSPSTFSPSTFSPSTFSPDAYAPSTFSPSTFSPSTFSPSTFSPSTFSPSTFSPSTFSPSTFSPSTFSPSTFSPSTFSPSTFSPSSILGFDPTQVAQAFSSAQTRSIVGVSATPGTGDESVVLNTWNSTGNFYVRVSGRGGAFSTGGQFALSVTKGATSCTGVNALAPITRPAGSAGGVMSVILTDSSKVALDAALPNGGTLRSKLLALAGRTEVKGVIVDIADVAIDTGGRLSTLKLQAANNATCPYATNLVAEEIKSIVDSYRANNPLRYVVIVGNDGVIPFFRYPDESLLGQESGYIPPVASASASDASLRQDFVLSQDAYGSSTRIAMRAIDFPVPGLAVGRLVETPAEIAGMIDAYIANSVVIPTSSLVTGYDFLADAAGAVTTELQTGGAAPQTLITANGVSPQDTKTFLQGGPWTATDLATKLFGSRHDVVFLAGHFSANSALAADFTTNLLTTDLAASTTDFTNSIVFSAGCHSGYNIVDSDAIDGVTLKLDWPQAFAQKKATLIAGTGYQYGDTDFIEYSERLYKNFARQLRAGMAGTAVSVGEALARAKIDYLAATPDIRGIHQKALLEATVFGLPMLGVNMPSGRDPNVGTAGVITPVTVVSGPAATLGLKTFDYRVVPGFQTNTLSLTNLQVGGSPVIATWLSTPDGVVSNPAEPTLPLVAANVTPTDPNIVLRGVGFLGGGYSESTIVPLTGAPTTELRGVHTPFLSPVFFPMRLWTPNYFGALAGTGGTKLLVTPAQHRAADVTQGTSTLRQFNGLNLRLYYSGNTTATALSAAPTIVGVTAVPDNGGVTFKAQVVGDPAAAIHEVWVTYTSGNASTGTWVSLPLSQCSATPPPECGTTTDSQQWMGRLTSLPANLKYIVQAVNGVGLVSADDNLGAYYSVGGTAPVATTLALVSPPTSATYGDSPPVTAKLSAGAGASSVAGKLVTVSVGGASQAGVTDTNGNVTVNVPISSIPSLPGTSYQLKASFSGDQDLLPSSVSAGGFLVSKAPSNLVALSPLGATLTGTIGGKSLPIDGSVAFSLTSTRGARTVFAITDYLGQAILPPPGLPAGTYNVTGASYGGNATYNAAALAFTQAITIPKANQTITFASLLNKTYGDPDFAVTATTTSSLTVSFGAGGACTVTGNTVHLAGAGTCTITASQAGNDDFNAAIPVPRVFAVAFAASTTSLSATPSSAIVGQPVTLSASVAAMSPAVATPTGNVTFNDGTTPIGSPATGASGAASLSTNALAVGTHPITAVYSGDAGLLGSTGGPITVTINQIPTATALTVDKTSPILFGTTINLAAAVTPGTATGTVSFLDGTATLATPAPLSGGTPTAPARASLAISTLGVGTHGLTARYAGDTNDAVSVSAPLTVVIKEAFTATGSMLQARTFHTATLLNDGRVLVAGGSSALDDDHLANRTAEIFCPDPYTLPATPARTLAQWCPNGVGKFSPAGRGNTAKIGVGNLVTARSYHTGTLLPDGTVLLAGGFDSSGRPTATAEIYDTADPIADRFTAVANLPYAPIGHTATLITKGTKQLVLVVGGISASSLLYDPATKSWTRSGSMTEVRSNHTASVITGAKVLVAGGTDILGSALQTTRLYDIGSGTFSSGPTMLAPRELHTASAIANNKVLLAGGLAGTLTTSTVALNVLAEIFDPSNTGTPFTGASFVSGTGRYGHTASALLGAAGPDGRVLVAGGAVNILCGKQLAASELFSSGTFATGAAMSAARVHHTATVLKDGRVLVAGGWGSIGSSCGPLNTAEIWTGPRSPSP